MLSYTLHRCLGSKYGFAANPLENGKGMLLGRYPHKPEFSDRVLFDV